MDQGQLRTLIEKLDLYVDVAWVGPHLNDYVHDRTEQNMATVFFDWVPNILTATANYTRVKFPSCKSRLSGQEACDFQVNQFSKVVWMELKERAAEAYHLLEYMSFTQQQYSDLLRLYISELSKQDHEQTPDHYYRHAACKYVYFAVLNEDR